MKLTLLKDFANGILAPLGFKIVASGRHQTIPKDLPDAEYYTGPDHLERLYRPWLHPRYNRWFRPEVVQNTMLGRQKLYTLFHVLRATLKVPGDIFEAGAGSGGSGRLMLDVLDEAQCSKRLWFLDTFEGYRKVDPVKDGTHIHVNDCRCAGFEDVKALLRSDSCEPHLVKGLIPGTLEEVKADRISFAHIDVNLNEPTLAATSFVLERLSPGGAVVFDDYGWPAAYGARKAIEEACEKHGFEPISMSGEQAFLFKATA